MSIIKHESSLAVTPPSSSCPDPLDIEKYLDINQFNYQSPNSPTLLSNPNLTLNPSGATSNVSPNVSQASLDFPNPSHRYGEYKQQSSLPVGALANTLAVNQASTLSYGNLSAPFSIGPTDGYFKGSSTIDFDFNGDPLNASFDSAYDGSTAMDVDFDMSTRSDFVDPNAIGGREDTSPTSTQNSSGRIYPGIHQQQAAQAQQRQQQKQQQQQQQMLLQQPRRLPSQQPLPSAPKGKSGSYTPNDPIFEERISRLINQMRQGSVTSSNEDDEATPNANGSHSQLARSKKEEDMDEDERLLASEEGKKLSSKERRQLRNKVSARAFRARRKDYISQLEGELAGKQKEINNERARNKELMAENARLIDVTRMLFSSPAFSAMIDDMSGNPTDSSIAPSQALSSSTSSQSSQQPRHRQGVNPNNAARQSQPQNHRQNSLQVGMTMIPDTTVDFSSLQLSNAWATNNTDFGFNNNQPQVFAVLDVPRGPAIDRVDTGLLSGKTSNFVGSYASDDAKEQAPTSIERMPAAHQEKEKTKDVLGRSEQPNAAELDESDPAYALFADCPATAPATSRSTEPQEQLFGSLQAEKVFARVDLCVLGASDSDELDASVVARFERLCSGSEAAFERIGAATAHL